MCKTINLVPEDYFAPLDHKDQRTDILKRPELKSLSIDIMAPDTYMSRPPMPCVYFLVIDISIKAQENEFISLVLSTLADIIQAQGFLGFPRTEIGIILFDKSVHFVNLASEFPIIYSETEINDLFLPVPADQLLVTLEDIEEKLIKVLDLVKNLILVPYSTCYLAALRAAGLVLQNQGGKILAFCGEMIIDVPHPLQFTFKLNMSTFLLLSKEYTEFNISCTQYIRSSQFCNLQVLVEISKTTGGQVFFYPHFNAKSFGEKLRNEIMMGIAGLTA